MPLEADDAYSLMVKSKSPLAYWRLAELITDTSSVLDYIGSRNGTAVNTPTREVASLVAYGADRCYDFNGTTQRIDFTDDAGLEFTSGSFTVGAWIRPRTIPDTVTWRTIIHKNVGTAGYGFSLNSSKLYGSTGNGTTGLDGIATTTLIAGRTYLGGYTYDSAAATITFYLNGVADGTLTSMPQPAANTAVFTIGSDAGGASFFDGRIDEPFVTATKFTAADWMDLYTIGTGYPPVNTFNAIPFMGGH